MKKILFLTTIIILLFCSCANNTSTELTDEQKAIIETEVKVQLENVINAVNLLDFDLWAESFSKDNFISQVHIRRGITTNWDTYSEEVKASFQNRTRHISTETKISVTALSAELAISTDIRIWENWYKNGYYSKQDGKSTCLWKKEQDSWKIIQVTTGGLILEETTGN